MPSLVSDAVAGKSVSATLRERGKERRGGAAQATLVPPVWGPVPSRQRGGGGAADRGGGRPVATSSAAAGPSSNHCGCSVPTRPGRAQRRHPSDHPAVIDHGTPGAGCPVAAVGTRRRGGRAVR